MPDADDEPCSSAWKTLEDNLDMVGHFLHLVNVEVDSFQRRTDEARSATEAARAAIQSRDHLEAQRLLNESSDKLSGGGHEERLQTVALWIVVMLVTCVEGYLQDLLVEAAGIDKRLMNDTAQTASYNEILAATTTSELAQALRTRWARNWTNDGGPRVWIDRLDRMGVKTFAPDLAARLELIWGIRHITVHGAGVASADFVKRHPTAVAAVGDRVTVEFESLSAYWRSAFEFADAAEAFFCARYPTLATARDPSRS
jgi:hypothetical protein